MENSLKSLILAAGIVITCLVVGVGFYVSREAKQETMTSTGQIQDLIAEAEDANLIVYDGAKVSGNEVLWVMEHIASTRRPVYVQTMEGLKMLYKTREYYDQAYEGKENEKNYINPNAIFIGEVIKNENGVISCLSFCQEGAEPSDLWYDLSNSQ